VNYYGTIAYGMAQPATQIIRLADAQNGFRMAAHIVAD
jgi:hypothetical protein